MAAIAAVALFALPSCNLPAATKNPAAASPSPAAAVGVTPIHLGAAHGAHGGWFDLYFTDPSSPLAPQHTGGLDGPLVQAIESARLTIDLAIYDLTFYAIRDALLRAHHRGVRVRVATEGDNLARPASQALIEAGIPVRSDSGPGLMHNKFMLIDQAVLWTGSLNYTTSGLYDDANSLIRIASRRLVEDYAAEFDEMFEHGLFGDESVAKTPHPRVIMDGTPIDVYFSPDDGVEAALLDLIVNANRSIDFMSFTFTSDPLGSALRERAAAGIGVRGVMDSDQIVSGLGSEYSAFRQAGLDIRSDGLAGQMHHKVLILDGQVVVLGSYNFTRAAESRNDENLLVIYDGGIAAEFLAEFQRQFQRATP